MDLNAFLERVRAKRFIDYLDPVGETANDAFKRRLRWARMMLRDPNHAEEAEFLLAHERELGAVITQEIEAEDNWVDTVDAGREFGWAGFGQSTQQNRSSRLADDMRVAFDSFEEVDSTDERTGIMELSEQPTPAPAPKPPKPAPVTMPTPNVQDWEESETVILPSGTNLEEMANLLASKTESDLDDEPEPQASLVAEPEPLMQAPRSQQPPPQASTTRTPVPQPKRTEDFNAFDIKASRTPAPVRRESVPEQNNGRQLVLGLALVGVVSVMIGIGYVAYQDRIGTTAFVETPEAAGGLTTGSGTVRVDASIPPATKPEPDATAPATPSNDGTDATDEASVNPEAGTGEAGQGAGEDPVGTDSAAVPTPEEPKVDTSPPSPAPVDPAPQAAEPTTGTKEPAEPAPEPTPPTPEPTPPEPTKEPAGTSSASPEATKPPAPAAAPVEEPAAPKEPEPEPEQPKPAAQSVLGTWGGEAGDYPIVVKITSQKDTKLGGVLEMLTDDGEWQKFPISGTIVGTTFSMRDAGGLTLSGSLKGGEIAGQMSRDGSNSQFYIEK